MDSIRSFAQWITKRLFPISIVIFVLIYIWWFRLTPLGSQSDSYSNQNYIGGLILFFVYVVSGISWWLTKNRNSLGMLCCWTTIFFFILDSCFVIIFLPRVIDSANYNRTTYYLVSYSTLPDAPYEIYQLAKWHGLLSYEIIDQPDYLTWKGKLFYDKKTNLVNVVAVFDDRNYLLYTDDNPPRYYEYGPWQLGKHLYYVSSPCSYCDTGPYTMYECELDSTLCVKLPFQYAGKGVFDHLQVNEKTKDVDFFVGLDPNNDVLVYTYGEHPRCYVDECEILKSTK